MLIIHRHMGMGPQSSLPLFDSHRRPFTHSLSFAFLAAPSPTPPLLLPYRNLPLYSSRLIAPLVLGSYEWQPSRHRSMANPTEPLPSCPRVRLYRTTPLCLARGP